MNKLAQKITQRFDEAASYYDAQASMQSRVAMDLAAWAKPQHVPDTILDIGSGTGFVAEAASKRWPHAQITALDHAPSMLQEAQRKLPQLKIIKGDAAQNKLIEKFDIILSSMMLHWLPQPLEALQNWRRALQPQGRLYAALLTEGSFKEWADLCHANGIKDGLWTMPKVSFANSLTLRREEHKITIPYPSAHEFLRRLKDTGAATPQVDHTPLKISKMRALLSQASKPFSVSYNVLYLEISAAK